MLIGFAAHGMIMALGMEGGNVLTIHQTLRLPSKCALLRFLHASL